MKLFAISDLHLAQSVDKPMDIFGSRWANHIERIVEHWRRDVSDGDAVLIGGDISWAKSLEEAELDFGLLNVLPGEKILLRGNHDYWWTTKRKMEQFCFEKGFHTLRFLRNDAITVAGFHVCGARGWLLPQDKDFSKDDEKILNRERIRLDLSLEDLGRLRKSEGRERSSIALMHYPPISATYACSAIFTTPCRFIWKDRRSMTSNTLFPRAISLIFDRFILEKTACLIILNRRTD